MRHGLASCAASLGLVLAGLATGMPAAATTGPLADTTPTRTVLRPQAHHQTTVFSLSFDSTAPKERRLISSQLVVTKATARIFLGQALTCTSPSGVSARGMETGRNFWPGSVGPTVASFVLPVNEAGRWTCESTVMLCDPGYCDGGPSSGSLTLGTRATSPSRYSVMTVSAPLDQWSVSAQVPSQDTAVKPGSSATFSKTFDTASGAMPAVLAEFSFTNCIEADYPAACSSMRRLDIDGSSRAAASMTITQVPKVAGAQCMTYVATRSQGAVTRTITANQHHATFAFLVPSVALSTSASCSDDVTVSVSFRQISGNGFVVEGGSKANPQSLISVISAPAGYVRLPAT